MLELFRTHFHDITESLDLTIDIVTDKIEEKKHRTRRLDSLRRLKKRMIQNRMFQK